VNAEIVTAVSLCVLFVLTAKFLPRSFITLVIGHTVLAIPYVVMSVKPKLEQMDPSSYEAAMDLGATQTQSLFKVIIPDIVPGILSGFLLSVTLSLDDYVITTFTKPGNFETISTYVDSAMRKGGLPTQLRAFTAILFGVILLAMIGMYVKSALDVRKQNRKLKGVD
jgi:spermidine/putrescine transport system permease protein